MSTPVEPQSVPAPAVDEVQLAPSNRMNVREVRRTANDALLSKLSASLRGYFHDDFLHYFSFPIVSEYLPLQIPALREKHDHVQATRTLPDATSPFPLVDQPPTFQNTPYSPLPTSVMPTSASAVMPTRSTVSPQHQSNLDLTFPRPLSNHSLSQHQPGTPTAAPFSPFGQVPSRFVSTLPPSLLPSIPSTVPSNILPRRSPLINKGYACRVHALDKIVVDFIQTCEQKGQRSQILSIGAGYDTTYFRLKYHHNIKPTQYIELDFPHTIAHKANLIHHPQNAPLLNVVNSFSSSQYSFGTDSDASVNNMYTTFTLAPSDNDTPPSPTPVQTPSTPVESTPAQPLQSALFTFTPTQSEQAQQQSSPFAISYHDFSMIGCDGRDVVSLQKCLAHSLWNPNYPTLMLFECVLVYIPPQAANDMLQTLSRMHNNITMIAVYEQMHPNDPFGRTMMQNLHERGCPLLSLPTYPDLQHQLQRFRNFGFQTFTGWSLAQIAQHFTPCPGVEVLDEMEEYQLMSSHYTVFTALKDPSEPAPLEEPVVVVAEDGKKQVEEPEAAGAAQSVTSAVQGPQGSQGVTSAAPDTVSPSPKPARTSLSQRSSQLTTQTRRDPYANLQAYSRQHGKDGPVLTVPGTESIKCSGDYDWCTSILDPTPYKYTPNYHPSQIPAGQNDTKVDPATTQQASKGKKEASFASIGFMGCFPPSYQTRSIPKRNGGQLIVD